MNRANENHFANLSLHELNKPRSRFDLSHTLFTAFNTGQLIPLDLCEVYPGDNWNVSTKHILRLETLIKPQFSDMYIDRYYFFVPFRLIWDDFEYLLGSVGNEPWVNPNEFSVPQIISPSSTGWTVGSLADYFGLPIGVPNLSVSALPFRAYCKIYNDWFRDQNLQYEIDYNTDSMDVQGSNGDNTTTFLTTAALGGQIPNISKFRDYFTSCLPSPQRGESVSLPLGSSAPVMTGSTVNWYNEPIRFANDLGIGWSGFHNMGAFTDNDTKVATPYTSGGSSSLPNPAVPFVGSNFIVDLSNATGSTINDLRNAFAIQRILERSARSGSRYFEYLLSAFGVHNGDLRLGRSEYLGGCRSDININEVLQTSQTTESSPLGNEGAHSVSGNYQFDFSKAFTEHGYLICLGAVRYIHSYNQGTHGLWFRKNRYDFYDPALAYLGEQPVYNREIFTQGNDTDNEVFGYNEAWANLRFLPNNITGAMRTNAPQSLSVWHLGDNYSELPKLSNEWIMEDTVNVDRIIEVSSENSNQFIAEFYFDYDVYRVLPTYSIPSHLM